jgi:beta-lactam-binding protein with PASTA domain
MPSLTGLEQAAAERVLTMAGLRYKMTGVTQTGSAAGTVIGQTPPRGSKFAPDSPIELSVAQ